MTGRVVLQKVVADNGVLKLPDGVSEIAPEEWRERFKTKKAAKVAAVVSEKAPVETAPEAEPASQF